MAELTTSRIIARIIFAFLVYAGILFGTAGTLAWPAAWAYLALQFSVGIWGAFWMKKHDPGLLEKRMSFNKGASRGWDQVFVWCATILFVPMIALPGLDAIRYQWSHVPLAAQVAAFGGLVMCLAIVMWVFRYNSFAARVVEIQTERGHKVITDGPYRYVRHPMYVAALIMLFCLPIALGSWRTLWISAAMAVLFVIRTALEDRTLHEELDGYPEYARQTRYRLIPGVW